PDHGALRSHPRQSGQHVYGELGVAIRDLCRRCSSLRRPHRLGHAATQERVYVWRDGRGSHTTFSNHGRAVAVPELLKYVYAPATVVWPTRRMIAGQLLT